MAFWPKLRTVFVPGAAEPAVYDSAGNTYTASSFGVELTTFGPQFRARDVINGERARSLDFRESFFTAKHHHGKVFDFDGRMAPKEGYGTQPFIGGAMPTFYVPLSQRRPLSPYRLARVIVTRFTSLVFGHERFPSIRVVGDPVSQDFAEALCKAARLAAVMVRARNIGGSVGTVGLSWRFHEGLPRVLVHNGKHLVVHSWADREQLVPEHVSEIYQYDRDEWDREKKKMARVRYWHRRDWTPKADVAFLDQRVLNDHDPEWVIDETETYFHEDGFCHFVWLPNLPEDDLSSIDGQPDYAELYDNFFNIDSLNSVVSRGGIRNLDPTLVLKVDPEMLRQGVSKGSDNALAVGEGGDAKYMELSGSSITSGNSLLERERAQALEVAQCVVSDPNTIAAAGTSALAIRLVYAPMLDKSDILREQYGLALERLLEQMIASARSRMTEPAYELNPETGEQKRIDYVLKLPPRVVESDVLDEQGQPTGDTQIDYIERKPGEGGDVELAWGPYYRDTATDRQAAIMTLMTSSGGKPVLSHKSAVEMAAAIYGLDPIEEWETVLKQLRAEELAAQMADAAMVAPSIGGEEEAEPLPADGGEEAVDPTQKYGRLSPKQEKEILASHNAGASVAKLAKLYGVTEGQIKYALQKQAPRQEAERADPRKVHESGKEPGV